MFRRFKIHLHERGLLFREGEFLGVLKPGVHWRFDPLFKLRLDRVRPLNAWLVHNELDLMVKSGRLGDEVLVADLKDHERGLLWIDGRYAAVLNTGVHAFWKSEREVRLEIIDARAMNLVHDDLPHIARSTGVEALLEVHNVTPGHAGLWFRNGVYQETLGPGTHAFWKNVGTLKLYDADLREQTIDISGQEIMTSDKVTLRVNALVTFRIADALRTVSAVDEPAQALYRVAQLALRENVGARDLDTLLVTKDALGRELAETIRPRAAELGYAIVSAGVRDVILPGEMKELMNKVTEAKKAAEASLITRREETAAMRMQANTAKILESSPTLMKLRELETLEKVADKANLTVVLGENGLADRVVKLL
jgi:regulator of protease activity HflC (stomatin/prohibitin superfamily)